MDRFILFAGMCNKFFSPKGGFADYIATFPSAINAYHYVEAMNNTEWEWYEIVEIKPDGSLILIGNENTLPEHLTET